MEFILMEVETFIFMNLFFILEDLGKKWKNMMIQIDKLDSIAKRNIVTYAIIYTLMWCLCHIRTLFFWKVRQGSILPWVC